MKVYLGGPINGCSDIEASGWRELVKVLLEDKGHEWVDPMSRDYRGREMDPGVAEEIVTGDKADIGECDVLLMNCPKPSYGTAMEILYGWEAGKRVVVVLPEGSVPSPWVAYHSHVIHFGRVSHAVSHIGASHA